MFFVKKILNFGELCYNIVYANTNAYAFVFVHEGARFMETYNYFSITFAPCIGVIFLLIFLYNNSILSKKIKGAFYALIFLELSQIIFYSLELWTSTFSEPVMARTLLSALGYSIRIIIAYIILRLSIRNLKNKKILRLISVPVYINLVASFSAFFSDIVFSYTITNEFVRGPLGYIPHVISILYLSAILITVITEFHTRSKLETIIVFSVVALIAFSIVTEAMFNIRDISQICTVLSIIFYYMFFQSQTYVDIMHEENKIKEALTQKASTDGLTGILNKTAFEDAVTKFLAQNNSQAISLIVVDLDYLKKINDTLGHLVGDQAIIDTANKLQDIFRKEDIIGRFGGDEFLVFLKNIPKEVLHLRLEEILLSVKIKYFNQKDQVQLTASIGAVFCEKNNDLNWTELFNLADKAVYQAKDNGRDQYVIDFYND